MKVLIVEDNLDVALNISDALEQSGHLAVHAQNGVDGMAAAMGADFDVIILDRALGDGPCGLDILRELREGGDMTPVLLISGLGSVQDKVFGLKAGANDYLVKPVALCELVARVEALTLPRKGQGTRTVLSAGDVRIDLINRVVTRGGKRIDLQPREYKLLEYLVRHSGQVVTKMQLLQAIWNTRFDPGTSVIEVHLSRLRKKIDSPFKQHVLHTVRNAGFTFRPAFEAPANENPAERPLPAALVSALAPEAGCSPQVAVAALS